MEGTRSRERERDAEGKEHGAERERLKGRNTEQREAEGKETRSRERR
jgi:hypothetical protein